MYRSHLIKPLASLLALSFVFPSHAQQSDATEQSGDSDKIIIVTANRSEQNINDTLAAVEVITRQDIERIQPESITDLLQSIAGLDIVYNGGAGQSSALFTRGTNSDHTLLLIDGVRIGSATLGVKNFSSIPVAQIERIEIVKGPRAALWGSDAIGGVIQIFTRRLENGESSTSLSFGSESYNNANISAGFGNKAIKNTVTLSYEKSDGFDVFDDSTDVTEDTQPDEDGYERLSAAIRGDYSLSDETQLDWVFQVDSGNSEYDSSFGGDETDYTNHLWNIRYTYTVDQWVSQFSVKQSRDQSISFGNGTAKSDASVFETRRRQINALARYQFTNDVSILAGIDHLIDDVERSGVVAFDGSVNDYAEVERATESAYVSSQFIASGLIGELTARYDDVEGVKSDGTFNASLGYKINPSVTVSLNRSKGFKAPTFNDLYFPGFGNELLQSEISYNTELLVKANWKKHSLLLAHYDNNIDQLIAYNPACFCSENIDSADITGLEFVYQFQHDSFSHKFSASNLDPKDKSIDADTGLVKNTRLLRRAKEHYSYEVTADFANFNLFSQFNYTGTRFDEVFGSPRQKLDSHLVINIGVGYQFSDQWNMKLKVNDVTDEDDQSLLGYNNLGQQVLLTVQYLNF